MSNQVIWAHRGASGYMPENTLAAFQKAVDLGADGVELDVQLTKDGQLVVIHDERIDRTSDGVGWVKDFTLEELRSYNFNKTHPEVEHADIPTMKEVFELLKPTDLVINIELKTGIFDYAGIEEKIVALTKEMGFEDRVIYSSFNHYSILKLKEINPDARVGFLYADGPIDMPEYGKKYGVDALHPALYNLRMPHFNEKCKELGLEVNVWTVNEEEYVRMCVACDVHGIITNYPDMARRVAEECHGKGI